MTLMGHDIKASDLFVAALENEGVTHIFALPGVSAFSGVFSLVEPVLARHYSPSTAMSWRRRTMHTDIRPLHIPHAAGLSVCKSRPGRR